MSSETSIEARLKPDPARSLKLDQPGLQPWQFFVLAGLGCATAVTFIARGRGFTTVILLTVLMAAAALVGLAVLRMIQPLVSPEDDRAVVIGRRTREVLEREKMLALRAIKELEFDRAMGKMSEEDFKEMSARLRARAARLIRQLDAGDGYRSQIERELEKRLGEADARLKPSRYEDSDASTDNRRAKALAEPQAVERVCTSCATVNDVDARFCKNCGNKL